MKIPNHAQPIIRETIAANVIEGKGIIIQRLSVEEKCRRQCNPKTGASLAACIAFCVFMNRRRL